MLISELAFEWLISLALIMTCLAPVLLLGLFIKDFISKIYKSDEADSWLKKASDKKVKELAKKLTSGVRFATNVFDGATEKNIEEMLELADLDKSAKTTLFNGITGEAFAEEVTIRGNKTKRPDVVIYVNGIALGVLELKRSTRVNRRRLLAEIL